MLDRLTGMQVFASVAVLGSLSAAARSLGMSQTMATKHMAALRIGNMEDSSLVARKLAPCRTIVCAAPAYLKENGTPKTVSELAVHNCLGYTLSRSVGVGRWQFGDEKKISVPVSGSLKANNGDALVAAAIAGQGIVCQPTFLVAREIAAGLLVPIRLDHNPAPLDGIFAVYPPDRRPPPKVRTFIDFLAENFRPVPHWDRISQEAGSG
jgi:DNA-binding transcriptional LysR family regulator